MAEAGVKIAELILKKNQDPSLGLLEYRSTSLENGYSPAELLMGRKLRTTLPIAPENLNPKLVDSQTLKRKEGRRRKDMKSRYDRRCGATDMEELSEGRYINVQTHTTSDYRIATKWLEDRHYTFHFKILDDEKCLRVVVRGLDRCITIPEIQEDLENKGFEMSKLARLRNSKTKEELPLIQATQRLPEFHLSCGNSLLLAVSLGLTTGGGTRETYQKSSSSSSRLAMKAVAE
ncbi:hypothetical protein LAZ67_19002112 [Cordylochernes scorpioides]|uniref:Uncharacterized protein n=1 Tax=Cordylochernes scorpioides TaxID=51811 RepID=A0ABY6LM17_9ARAC|nr:hypothetical protein LAZ67_19002112 [Cordylochernes scorpioides]